MMEFTVIKAYKISPYNKPWTTQKPDPLKCFDTAYFIKVDGLYFKLGEFSDSYILEDKQ